MVNFVYIKIYCFIIVYLVCVLSCKIYLVSSIAILLVVIVSNIGDEKKIILICYNKYCIVSRCVLKLV